jgi:hypothetical protein
MHVFMLYSVHVTCTARNPQFGISGGRKSFIRDFLLPEIRHSGFLAARNHSFGFLAARNPSFGISGGQKSAIRVFWRPEICNSGFLVARNPEFGHSGGEKSILFIYMYIYMYICMCLCGGIPYMVLARREVRHSRFLATRNPSFGISGG